MDANDGWGYRPTPDHFLIKVFSGASNEFNLYEDDGESNHFETGAHANTRFTQEWHAHQTTFTIHPATGQTDLLPSSRTFTLAFQAINNPANITFAKNGATLPCLPSYDEATRILTLTIDCTPFDQIAVTLTAPETGLIARPIKKSASSRSSPT